ncbi:Tetratricopeptide repeat protein [Planctomycetes bacterium Pla163]|uniref:Tetratricopeptide repeat protein n=1 Tax=Rohdeia mirabilis TaxID=2528008 RepID=A0A518D374_9BACT|nr:Tetratricopeptide repeat protein [Planctomycetes bacterium Pla163]
MQLLSILCALPLAALPVRLHAAPCVEPPAPATASDAVALRDEVDDLIEKGRAALDESKLVEAEEAFQAAANLDEARGRIWLLRLELSRGSAEEVLGQLGQLRRAGNEGPDYTYLWGIAFATKVERDLAAGDTTQAGFMIADARRELAAAIAADPTRYRDAHLYLARVCRHDGDSAASMAAAESAIEHYPGSVEAHELMGRGALGVYASIMGDEAQKERAAKMLEKAVASTTKAIELCGRPRGEGERGYLASLDTLLGDIHAFGGDLDAAAAAYGAAIGQEPAGFDYGRAYGTLGVEKMLAALESGRAAFAKRAARTDARMATVDWWLGYTLLAFNDPARYEEGEKAFMRSLELWPAYTANWYYIGRLRFSGGKHAEAIEAFKTLAEIDRASLVSSVANDAPGVNVLYGLIRHCMEQNPPALLDAGFCSEIQAEAFPQNHKFWNNVGLFYRDAADMHVGRKGRTGMSEKERETYMPMYETSFAAYEKALALDPENPGYLNDGAVILHFYLEREYDRALEMYAQATRFATELLAEGTLKGEEKGIVELALRDSRNNRRLLEAKIERQKEKDGEKDGGR